MALLKKQKNDKTDKTADSNPTGDMMRQIMEELRVVKEQLKSKLSFENSQASAKLNSVPLHAVSEPKLVNQNRVIRSPSDTIVWAPAVMRNTVRKGGVVQELENNSLLKKITDVNKINEVNEHSEELFSQTDVDGKIDKFLSSYRLDAQQQNQEPNRSDQGSRRRLNFDQAEDVPQPGPSMRDQAHQRILEAEKYRVQMEKPQGMELQSIHSTSLSKVQEFPNAPIIDDDEYLHMTSNVEDIFAKPAHESQFVDLEKMLSKQYKSASSDEAQKLEFTSKDGQIFYLPKEDRQPKITNFHTWEKAFRLYMALYAQKHPNKVGEMLQYIFNIGHAALQVYLGECSPVRQYIQTLDG